MQELTVVDVKDIAVKAQDHLSSARALVVESPEQFTRADVFCVGLKELEKEIISTFKEPKEKAWQSHKAIVAAEAKHLEPVQEARKIAKGKMVVFQEAEERKRQEDERRRQAEARREEEDRKLREAEALEKAGDKKSAQEVIESPVVIAPVKVVSQVPKSSTVFQERWDFQITDPTKIPREYLTVDTVRLGAVVRATKGALEIPGVRIFSKKV